MAQKGDICMENNDKVTVRNLEVIYADSLKGLQPISVEDVFQYPLYKVVKPGVLKADAGIKRNPNDTFVFDVSSAPEWFKEKFKTYIRELSVKSVIGELPVKPNDMTEQTDDGISVEATKENTKAEQIITVMSLLGGFSDLESTELEALGDDFVELVPEEQGIDIKPFDSSKGGSGNIYLRLNTQALNGGLMEKIAPDISELCKNSHGLYDLIVEGIKYDKDVDNAIDFK